MFLLFIRVKRVGCGWNKVTPELESVNIVFLFADVFCQQRQRNLLKIALIENRSFLVFHFMTFIFHGA